MKGIKFRKYLLQQEQIISVSYTDLWKSIYMIRTPCLNKDD